MNAVELARGRAVAAWCTTVIRHREELGSAHAALTHSLLPIFSLSARPPCRGSLSLPLHPGGRQGQGAAVPVELELLRQ